MCLRCENIVFAYQLPDIFLPRVVHDPLDGRADRWQVVDRGDHVEGEEVPRHPELPRVGTQQPLRVHLVQQEGHDRHACKARQEG